MPKKNERVWVKFHLATQQGIKNLTDQEAEGIVAKDRESHQRDLLESIAKGDFPRWTMYIQVMTEEQARNTDKPGGDKINLEWPKAKEVIAKLKQQVAAHGRDPESLEISVFEKSIPDKKTIAEMETEGVGRIILTLFGYNREEALPALDRLAKTSF